MSRAVCVAVLCGVFGAPATALASPRSDATAGRAVFTGATTPGAPSIDLNPAALGLSILNELYIGAMASVDRYAIDTANALGPAASVRDTTFSPGAMVAWIIHIKDRGTIALELRSAPAEMFASGEALRYHSLGGSHRTYGGTAGAELRVTNEILIGASFAAQPTYLKLHYARDTALEAGHGPGGIDSDCLGSPCGVGNSAAAERYDIDVHAAFLSSITLNVGLVIQLARDVWMGVSYHTQPGWPNDVQNVLDGTLDVTRAPRDGGGVLHGGATVLVSQPASVDSELRARVAPRLDLHVGMRWEDLSRLSQYDVRSYGSAVAAAGIPEWTERARGLHDPLAVWAGLEQVDTGETWRFGARLGLETSSLPDNRTSPWTIAPTSVTADVGAQLRLPAAPNVVFQLSYGLQYFPTVSVRDSAFDPNARLACIDSGYDYSTPACEAVRLGYAIPSANGDYGRMEHAFRLGIRYEY